MKTTLIIMTLFLLISCRHEVSETLTSFDRIDVSLNKGPGGIISVYVDSTKVFRVRITDKDRKSVYYQDTLNDIAILKLNKLSNELLSNKFDSVVGRVGCFSFPCYFELTSKTQQIHTLMYQDVDYSNKYFRPFIENIIALTKTIKHYPLDTIFSFNSFQKVVEPPPPLTEMEKFIPPIIKDE